MKFLLLLAMTGLLIGCTAEESIDDGQALPRAANTVLGDLGKVDRLEIPITFDEFLNYVFCESDGRICVVDGDTPIAGGMAGLREFYERRVNPPGQALSVNWAGRGDDLWYGDARLDLSFCVSDDFGEHKQDVVDAMVGAASDWEAIAAVAFPYKPEQDHRCHLQNRQVLFPVLPTEDPDAPYLARAFFPSYEPHEQDVRVNMNEVIAAYADPEMQEMTLRGIMRHELGHVLGFRHEHTRDEAGAYYCFEDRNYRPGTSYDSQSVMHYPQCGGDNDWALKMSDVDVTGAAYFYPAAGLEVLGRCEEELNQDGTVNEECELVVRQITEWLSQYAFEEVIVDWMGLSEQFVEPVAIAVTDRPFQDLQDIKDRAGFDDADIRLVYEYLFVNGRCPESEVDDFGWLIPWCYPVMNQILEFVNSASFAELDDDVGLDVRAVENIVAARQIRPIDSYDALISLGYVKRIALYALYVYLYES